MEPYFSHIHLSMNGDDWPDLPRNEITPVFFRDLKKYEPHFYVSKGSLKSPFVSIHFNLKKSGAVSLDLFSSNGRYIKKIYGRDTKAGMYHLKLRKNIFPSGLFFLRLNANDSFSFSKKFILNK